jgi:hypothetical protein
MNQWSNEPVKKRSKHWWRLENWHLYWILVLHTATARITEPRPWMSTTQIVHYTLSKKQMILFTSKGNWKRNKDLGQILLFCSKPLPVDLSSSSLSCGAVSLSPLRWWQRWGTETWGVIYPEGFAVVTQRDLLWAGLGVGSRHRRKIAGTEGISEGTD